ncbi:MAG: hypothetical protein OXB84_01880 [Halobacteriovoraceae bacterium]|nr:hypothetical protein [Halobacteriovoraceae bacterium]
MKYMKTVFLLTIFQMIFLSSLYASIQKFDQNHYAPTDYGLRDLVFEVKILNLKNLIKEQLKISQVEDIYFLVYWVYPNIYRIKVNGLPDGFIQLKNQLTQQVNRQIDYVIPIKYSERLKGYQLETKKDGNFIVVTANDKTGTKDVNELKLFFDQNSKLKKTTALGLSGLVTSNYKMNTTKWNRKRFLIFSKDTINKKGLFTTTTKETIKYDNFDKFIFPKELVSIIKVQSKNQKNKVRTLRSVVEIFSFNNYIINKGVAKKYIDETNKK